MTTTNSINTMPTIKGNQPPPRYASSRSSRAFSADLPDSPSRLTLNPVVTVINFSWKLESKQEIFLPIKK